MENVSHPQTPITSRILTTNTSKSFETSKFRIPLAQIENLSNESPIYRSPAISDTSSKSSHSLIPSYLFDGNSKANGQSSMEVALSTPSPLQKEPRDVLFSTPINLDRRKLTGTGSKKSSKAKKKTRIFNPFEKPVELLRLPVVSPSLFKTVVSPSEKEDEDASWSIEQLALLYPTQIDTPTFSETDFSPDPSYERRAQEAIDRFFNNTALVVPSPWTCAGSRSLNFMSVISSGASGSPALCGSDVKMKSTLELPNAIGATPPQKPSVANVCCQTELTFPSVLPKEVEDVLARFCTYTQDQAGDNNAMADNSFLNNTTLRRKLMFTDETSNPCSVDDVPASIPFPSACDMGSSPASTGAHPLSEDDDINPWGASMIRPVSRVSINDSPVAMSASPSAKIAPFLSSSPENEKSVVSQVSFSVTDASPIRYFPPDEFRTVITPPYDVGDASKAPASFFASPKLSPIGSCDNKPKVTSPLETNILFSPITSFPHAFKTPSPRNDLRGPQIRRARFSYPMDSCPNHSKRGRGSLNPNSPTLIINNCRANFVKHSPEFASQVVSFKAFSHVDIFKSKSLFEGPSQQSNLSRTSELPLTPVWPKIKTSSQFSSSPIKLGVDDQDAPMRTLNSPSNLDEQSPMKLLESPSVSPIPWSTQGLLSPSKFKTKIAYEESPPKLEKPLEQFQFSYPMTKRQYQEDRSFADFMETDVIDREEISTGECSSGQDTGYQTTSSLLATNLTSQMGALSNQTLDQTSGGASTSNAASKASRRSSSLFL